MKFENIQENLVKRWKNYEVEQVSTFSQSELSEKNLELKNKQLNSRCFVLGNGPSLKNENLDCLKNEVVFCVNVFFKYEDYDKVMPDYYVIVDPYYFDVKYIKELNVIMKNMERLKYKEKKPVFIVPTFARHLVKTFYKWEQWTKVYYIENKLVLHKGYSKEYDITKPVPAENSVVRMAILLATYMGIKDIYLLGVEETGLLDNLGLYESRDYIRYAFDFESDEEKNSIEQAKNGVPLSVYLKNSIAESVKGYRRVFSYCEKRKVNLYNCTPASIIDSIPQIQFTSLFH